MECMPYDSKRARALQTLFYLLGRHRDAMRQWAKIPNPQFRGRLPLP